MFHEKRYLQFNNLIFDGYDMISNYSETIATKGEGQAYSYTHGSYRPFKRDYALIQEGSVTMTISIHTKKVPCEYREYYIRFAEQELMRHGKLWAIKNNEIIWAYAYVRNIHEIVRNAQNKVEWDIEFGLPEGIWHKADKQKTFVLPYNVCTFMECKGYKTLQPCDGSPIGDCCETCFDKHDEEQENCFCCCVDEITADMALCYHLNELQGFYSCDVPFQLVYSCLHADKFNKNDHLGQKLCVKDICESSVISGRFYSETDIPTENVGIIIEGKAKNPWITINGNTNVIQGEFDGTLRIEPSGDIYYATSDCCEGELLDPSAWSIPKGMDYGWTVYPQNNSITVNLNDCCSGMTCIYIQTDNITI